MRLTMKWVMFRNVTMGKMNCIFLYEILEYNDVPFCVF